MHDFKIEYLADSVDCLQARVYGRWAVQKKDGSLERAITLFEDGDPGVFLGAIYV